MAQASDWRGEYKRRLQSADEAVSRLQDGQRLILPTLAGQPPGLIAAMGRRLRAGKLARVRAGTILAGPDLAEALLQPEHSDSVDWDSLFCGTSDRLGVFEGRYDMTPIHFGQMPKIMQNDMKVGAVMTLVE